jgi:hypothetical protein
MADENEIAVEDGIGALTWQEPEPFQMRGFGDVIPYLAGR